MNNENEIESQNDSKQIKEFGKDKPNRSTRTKTASGMSVDSINKLCLWIQEEAEKNKRAPRIAAQYGAALSFFFAEIDGLSKMKGLK